MNAHVICHGSDYIEVCVPREWNDERVTAFAGKIGRYQIRQNPKLQGRSVRVQCEDDDGFVHVVLDQT